MNEHDTTPVPTNEITVEEVDIEEYVRSKRPIPHANRYVIRIDTRLGGVKHLGVIASTS